jgi:hypothetical protein
MSQEKVEEIKFSKVLRGSLCVVEEYRIGYKQVLVEEVLLCCFE